MPRENSKLLTSLSNCNLYLIMNFSKEETISEQFKTDMAQFQILLNMLYERSIRTCYENSLQKFIDQLRYSVKCFSESIEKDITQQEITEQDFLHFTNDAILIKRLENKINLKVSLVFSKEKA